MYKVYCFNKEIGESETLEGVEALKKGYTEEYISKRKEQLNILNRIRELLKNVPYSVALNVGNNKGYVNYVKKNHKNLIELLYKVAKIRGEEVLGFFISAPVDNSMGLKIKDDSALGFRYMSVIDYDFDVNKYYPNMKSFTVVEE